MIALDKTAIEKTSFVLGFVILATLIFISMETSDINYPLLKNNMYFVLFLVLLNGLSLAWLLRTGKIYLLKKNQGAKLEDIKKQEKISFKYILTTFIRKTPISIIISILTLFYKINVSKGVYLGDLIALKVYSFFSWTLILNIAFTQASMHFKKNLKKQIREINISKLPAIEDMSDAIILGTTGEDKLALDDKNDITPKWLKIPLRGLMMNLCIIGGIGTGKTTGFIIPIIKQLLKHQDDTIIITDAKATLYYHIKEIIVKSNRVLHLITLDSKFRINTLYNPNQLKEGKYLENADLILECALNILKESGRDKFWNENGRILIRTGIILTHVKHDYYTYNTLKSEILEINDKTAEQLKEDLDNKIHLYDKDEVFNIEKAITYIKSYTSMSAELRKSIETTAVIFLNSFDDSAVARIFCPKKEEINLTGLQTLLDKNTVIMTYFLIPSVQTALGTYVKLLINKAVKEKFHSSGKKTSNIYHIIDEYHMIASSSDAENTSILREFGLIHILAFQSMSQMITRMPSTEYANELLANLVNKIFLRTDDDLTIEKIIKIAGKHEQEKYTRGLSENSQDAKISFIDGNYISDKASIGESVSITEEEKTLIKENDITRLSSYEAIAYVNNGASPKVVKLFAKPFYLDRRMPHTQILSHSGDKWI